MRRPLQALLFAAVALALQPGCAPAAVEARTPMAPAVSSIRVPPAPVKPSPPRIAVDSEMGRGEALGTNRFPSDLLEKMRVVDVQYFGFDGLEHRGQIVVARELASDVAEIFNKLDTARFPIEKVIPIVRYGWNDEASMADNNTSGFNYRKVETAYGRGRTLSKHSFGRAIDLNPRINPMTTEDGRSKEPYDPEAKGALTSDSIAVKIFRAHGWQWGGSWSGGKDYQHFVKP